MVGNGRGARLFEFEEGFVGGYLLEGGDVDGFDGAVLGGADALLHFHGFDDADFLALGDVVAGADADGDYAGRHGGAEDFVLHLGFLAGGTGQQDGRGAHFGVGFGKAFDLDEEGLPLDADADGGVGGVFDFDGEPAVTDAHSEGAWGHAAPPGTADTCTWSMKRRERISWSGQ